MANKTLRIKRNDDARTITDTLLVDGVPLDLSTATVSLLFQASGEDTIRRVATIVDAPNGSVSYDLTTADVDETKTFYLEWEVEFADGSQISIPQIGYHRLVITADLG